MILGRRRAPLLVVASVAALVAGCATTPTLPAPPVVKTVTVAPTPVEASPTTVVASDPDAWGRVLAGVRAAAEQKTAATSDGIFLIGDAVYHPDGDTAGLFLTIDRVSSSGMPQDPYPNPTVAWEQLSLPADVVCLVLQPTGSTPYVALPPTQLVSQLAAYKKQPFSVYRVGGVAVLVQAYVS